MCYINKGMNLCENMVLSVRSLACRSLPYKESSDLQVYRSDPLSDLQVYRSDPLSDLQVYRSDP